jgi:hypothetical protein
MANTLGGLSKVIENKINDAKAKMTKEHIKQTIASKVNSYNTNRQERKTEKAELRKTEIEALREERKKQAALRGERIAKKEYGTYKESRDTKKSYNEQKRYGTRRYNKVNQRNRNTRGSIYNSSNTPQYREQGTFVPPQFGFNAPDAWGNVQTSRPRQTQTPNETTTIRTGDQTVTIKKKSPVNTQGNQSNNQYSNSPVFPDILNIAGPSPTPSKHNSFGNRSQEASYPDVLGFDSVAPKKKNKKNNDPFLSFLS